MAIHKRFLENNAFSMELRIPDKELEGVDSKKAKSNPREYMLYPPNNCPSWKLDWWDTSRWSLRFHNDFIENARWEETPLPFSSTSSCRESRHNSDSMENDVFTTAPPSSDGGASSARALEAAQERAAAAMPRRQPPSRRSTVTESPLYSCGVPTAQGEGGFGTLETELSAQGFLLSSVKALYRESTKNAFESRVMKLSADQQDWLVPKAQETADAELKRAMASRLQREAFPWGDGVSIVLAWHGCRSKDSALQMFHKGMVRHNTRDSGFFGAGMYFTLDPAYAAMYAAGFFDGPGAAPPPPGSTFTMVLCAVAVSRVYPITRQSDYSGESTRCNYEGRQLEPRAVHMARVSAESQWQAVKEEPGADADAFAPIELVVSEEDDVLPLYMVSFSEQLSIDDVL